MLILDVTLLNYEEFKRYQKHIQVLSDDWWLRTEATEEFCYANAISCNLRQNRYIGNKVGVRPALIVSNIKAAPGEKIYTLGFTWTVLDIFDDGKGLLLCNYFIGAHHYDNRDNDWEKSELKEFIEKWLETALDESSIAIDLANEAEYILLQAFAKKYNLPKLTGEFFPKINPLSLYLVYTNDVGWDWQLKSFCSYQNITFAEFCERFNKKGEYLC